MRYIQRSVHLYIKSNKVWPGKREWKGGMWFETKNAEDVDEVVNGINMKNIPSIWLTNLDHGRRHQPLSLMTMDDNLKFSKHKEVKGVGYQKYDNYDAIEVPYTDAIPSDYNGVMGVPISFLDKYCPEQFEIVGAAQGSEDVAGEFYLGVIPGIKYDGGKGRPYINGKSVYNRILIRKKQ